MSAGPVFGPPSFWQADAPIPAWPRLDRPIDADVVVIGAGLAGLGVARALAARGRSVLILDARGPGAGASGRNAGFVLRAHVTAFPALRARVGEESARALLWLAEDTHRRIGGLSGAEHHRGGSLLLALDDAEAALLETARTSMLELGVDARTTRVPDALRGFAHAIELPDDGEVHPMRVCAALASGLVGRRATVSGVDLGARTMDAGVVVRYRTLVLCTNAWTSALVPALAVAPQRAQMLATAPLPRVLAVPCYARLGFDYFRQLEDGRLLVGGARDRFAGAEATDDGSPSAEVQAALEVMLSEHLRFAAGAAIERRWAGTMGFTASALPFVGCFADDAYACLGFTGHGLGIALGCAELCAREIEGERWPREAEALRAALAPDRAQPIST